MDRLQQAMHSAFEAELPHRLRRASRVTLQAHVPAHWFTAVATECAEMYVAGEFYGAIAYTVEGERVTPNVPRHWLTGTTKSPQVQLRQLW
jgi:hypothetical protein